MINADEERESKKPPWNEWNEAHETEGNDNSHTRRNSMMQENESWDFKQRADIKEDNRRENSCNSKLRSSPHTSRRRHRRMQTLD